MIFTFRAERYDQDVTDGPGRAEPAHPGDLAQGDDARLPASISSS